MLTINFRILALLLNLVQARPRVGKRKTRLTYFLTLASRFLPLTYCFVLLPAVGAEPAVLGVVKNEENANQWSEIRSRLQLAGVAYCVIDLSSIKDATDFSDRSVVFLPNIETLTSAQAIALEEWMSRGGRVITSGAVGNMSQPGVRQLLRSLLGAYWESNLSAPSNLQPLNTYTQTWVRQNGLNGTIQGGRVIPTGINSQSAAVWQSQDNPSAVVTTDRSTVLGWRWGVNADAPAQLDSAWLRAALSRYIQLPDPAVTIDSAAETLKNCNGTVATETIPPETQTATANPAPTNSPPAPNVPPAPQPTPVSTPSSVNAVAPKPKPIPIPQQSDDPLTKLTPPGLFANIQAIALKQELENLIGRFESAQLAANALGGDREQKSRRAEENTTASLSPQSPVLSSEQVVAEARKIANTLPQLVAQKDYAAARQQWLKAQQLLWNNYPTDRTLAQPEIRAMWLDRGTIVNAGSEQELAKIFDRLAAAGINTVFFETVNAGYTIYPSQVAPQPNPLVRGWDPLAVAVKLAHERDMELHAWVWAFAVGNQRHNLLVNQPADYPGPVITAHPDWASYDNRGSVFPPGQGKPFLDPANRAARQYLLQLFDEIVSRYQVDGIQLDYIRYPFQDPGANRTYGYGIAARQQFQQMTGVDPLKLRTSDRLWQQWTDFRTRQIDSFVAEVSQRLRQKRPKLIISAAVFPLSEHDRTHKLQQHWEAWANRGDVDLIVPMTYAPDTYRFQRLAQPWISSDKLGSTLLLPGIRLLNLPILEAVDQIQLARDLAVSGYSLFAVENLSSELQKIFNNTQGSDRNKSKEPIPYRQPFQTAAARYTALQQEWNFLLENDQLWLRGTTLSTFNTQAKDLESALNQLSEDPSPSRLAVAKASLSDFQSKFQGWMRPQSLENPYQVKVWSNRLGTLERLLNYGDRVVLKRESPPVAEQP